MPYIKQEHRDRLIDVRLGKPAEGSGELNYLITQLVVDYWVNHVPNYQVINDIMGALEGAKQEFYRRVAVPFENQKRLANGDVYPS